MANLKISYINVNGFRNQYKQQIILSRLQQLQFDIVFLQETHVTNIIEAKKFIKLWKGKAIWSFGSNRSRGVGILFNPREEKIQGLFGKYFSGNCIVTMMPVGDIDDIPDFLNMRMHDEVFTTRLTVLGMKLRCHNCRRRGHMPRNCTACGWCGSSAHITSDHPEGIPMTTFADRVRANSRHAPGRPGTALVTKVPQGGRAQSRSSVNNVHGKNYSP